MISLLFFLSGLIGLLYEVLWAKYLTLSLGSTAVAQTFVLSMFLGGLALGNACLGPKADVIESPLRLYGLLELGIAALGLASPILLKRISFPPSLLFQALLCAAVILPPTVLMGGTLPALSRLAIGNLNEMQSIVAWFYCLNSAGAVLGALLAGFYLIPAFGLDFSLHIAAGLNLAVAAAALALGQTSKSRIEKPAHELPAEEKNEPAPLGLLLVVVFLSGFVSLSYEIAWNRLLALTLGSSVYSFSLMLAAFITGIALGSLLVARGWHPRLGAYRLLGWVEFSLAFSILATARFYDRLPWLALLIGKSIPRTPNFFYVYEGCQLFLCFLLMLPPTICLGMALPLASRAAARNAKNVGRDVGLVFGLNALGNVLGAALAGLWLMPLLGLEGLIQAAVAVNLAAGGAVLQTASPWASLRKGVLAAACALVFAAQWAWAPPLDKVILSNGPFRNSMSMAGLPSFDFNFFRNGVHEASLVYYKDDREATVSVFKKGGILWLKVNGKTDASSARDMETQILQGHIPFLLNPGAKDILMIGLGGGVTAGSILRHPMERLDVAEISPAVVEGARHFSEVNHHALQDPRLHLAMGDGKTFLRRSSRSYDIILSDPSNPWIAGIGNLFSVEYYEEALARLKPGGLMAQWFHLYEMSDDTLRLILRTFCSRFQNVTLWQTQTYDILLIGSMKRLPLDFPRIAPEFERPEVRKDLARIGVNTLATIASLQMYGDPGVRAIAGQGPVNRDLFPLLEYEAPKAFFLNEDSEVLPDHDERAAPETSKHLALEQYVRFRNHALSRKEFDELAGFHGISGARFMLRMLQDGLRRFPSDNQIRLWLAQAQADAGQRDSAWATLQPLIRHESANAEALSLGADLASDQKQKLLFLNRLVDLQNSDKAQAYKKIAHLYETEEYEKAIVYLGKAASAAALARDAEQADALWMEAAILAVKHYDVPSSLAAATKALEQNPEDKAAQDMIRQLVRVQALDRENAKP